MNTKTVVITGSTRGIGLGLALEFLKKGHHVVINGTTTESTEKAIIALKEFQDKIITIPGNIRNEETIERLFDETIQVFGKVDIWINNAGIGQPYEHFWEMERDAFHQVIEINLLGTMIASHIVAKKMMQQGHGKIFNMEGLGSDGRIQNKMIVYGTSKRAVSYFSKALAKELSNSPIQIGVISPGMVFTDLLLKPVKGASEKDQKRMNKIFNILAEPIEKVAPFIVKRILNGNKPFISIQYLTNLKVMRKFIRNAFSTK